MLEDMGQFISGLWAMLLVMIVCSNYSVRASHWGVLPSQGTDGHSVHLLKTLFATMEGLGVGPLFLRYISVAPFGLTLFEESLATLLCFVAEII